MDRYRLTAPKLFGNLVHIFYKFIAVPFSGIPLGTEKMMRP